MKQFFSSKKWWALDLLICNVWLLFIWHDNWSFSLVLDFSFLRIWTSLLMHRKSKIAVVPLCVMTFLFLIIISIRGDFCILFWEGFKSILVTTSAVFEGNIEQFRASLTTLDGSALNNIIDIVGSLWLLIAPLGLFVYRWYFGKLQPLSISKKHTVGLIGYTILMTFVTPLTNNFGIYFTIIVSCACLILGLMWFYKGELKHLLTRSEIVYFSILCMLGFCYFCGVDLHRVGALILYLASISCYLLLSWYMGYEKKLSDILLVSISVLLFWLSPATTGMLRIVLLLLSLACIAIVCIRFALANNKKMTGIVMFALVGIAMPFLSMGFNPYSVLDYKVICKHHNYSNGVLVISDNEKQGLRDRYSVIMPVMYDKFNTINQWGNYLQAYSDGKFQIYDIEMQKPVSEEWFNSIEIECDSRYIFRLKSENGEKRLLLPHWDP